jgi:hypothetical protein
MKKPEKDSSSAEDTSDVSSLSSESILTKCTNACTHNILRPTRPAFPVS